MENSELPTGLIYPRLLRACFQFLTGDYKQGEKGGRKGVNLSTQKQQPEEHNANVQWGSGQQWALDLSVVFYIK